MLSIKTHNVLDYVAGLLLLVVPSLAGFADIDAARNVFVFGGLALIGYSLCTKYEFALWKKLPLGPHMVLDVALGVAIMAAPFLFDYRYLLSGSQEVVHYLMGLAPIALVVVTSPKTTHSTLAEDFRDISGESYRKAG